MTGNIVQSTYGTTQPIGAAGAPATMTGWDADSRIAEGNIGFGKAVSKGTSADNAVVIGGGLFAGISIRDITLVHTTVDRYQAGDNVGVLVRGDIWVVVENAVRAKENVLYNTSDGTLGHDGGTLIVGAVWMTSALAGGFAICRLGNAAGDLTT